MPLTNSVIRRYTPPTCTLEVLAQSSSLSRWVGKSVLKELRFELRLEDPQQPEEQRIVIRGDRDQLEALCAAVTNYVQDFLQTSPENFWANFSGLEDSSKVSDRPESQAPELQEQLQSPVSTQTANNFTNPRPETEIHIRPSNHLTHHLFLGSLGYQVPNPVVKLSLLQLFDLATALDEYSADVLALPALYQSRSPFGIPAWAPVAAVLIIAAGLIPFTYQYALQSQKQRQTAKKPAPTEEQLALESPSTLDLPTPTPALTPTEPLPSVPLGSGLSIPGSNLPPAPQTSPQAFPTAPVTPQASLKTTPSTPSLSAASPTPSFTLPSQSSAGNVLTTPQTTANLPSSGGKTPPLTPTKPQPTVVQPNSLQQNNTAPNPQSRFVTPGNELSPSSPSNTTSGISSSIPTVPPPIGTTPSNGGGNPFLNQQTNLPTSTSVTPEDTSKLVERLRQGRNTPTNVATSNTSFDFKTQVAEARQYLQKRWEPPSGLKQALEYSLIVGVDGTIERIFPLGKAARLYVDRTGMPLIGERFVSPNRNGQPMRIRAVLSPNGKVQTFVETD
ncbi:MAG: DUF4335 domain-containing protein [Fischerella sp.]|nr:DUF4335 domain-containing protein [Fischerella sp.]